MRRPVRVGALIRHYQFEEALGFMSSRLAKPLPWAVAALLYVLFLFWYMPWSGPLTEQEIDVFMESRAFEDEAMAAEFRAFLERDEGRPFVMVNLIELKAGGEEHLARYMDYMWPALLSRACHPIFSGETSMRAMDLWGIEGAEYWSEAALMRYRSLRDLLQIAGNDAFSDSHEFKLLAMHKTIAVPSAPRLNLADLRILFALVLLLAAALFRLAKLRRGGREDMA